MSIRYRYTFFGLSITSSWGNGHAPAYRALLKALAARGHEVTFLERDVEPYSKYRDLPLPSFAKTVLYRSLEELLDRCARTLRETDLVIVGSDVAEGIEIGDWVQRNAPGRCAFYDLDTPLTLAALERRLCRYLTPEQVAGYALYLSSTGGPTLARIEQELGVPAARPLYASVDPAHYFPIIEPTHFDLAYLGTYRDDRQPVLERLLFDVARSRPHLRFAVAGAHYPKGMKWPSNVEHAVHLSPAVHRRFYAEQRWSLNLTRRAMATAGWSPSVRLFEAAACGTPIVTDRWRGLEEIFTPGREVLVADTTDDILRIIENVRDEDRRRLAEAARRRTLAEHTAMNRAESLERYTREVLERGARRARSMPSPARTWQCS